jgi:hypothetical protein
MPGGDAIEARFPHGGLKKPEPRLARRLFQIAIGGQFRVADDRLPAKLFRLTAHKLGVSTRLIAPQSVVQMQNGEDQFPLRSEFS